MRQTFFCLLHTKMQKLNENAQVSQKSNKLDLIYVFYFQNNSKARSLFVVFTIKTFSHNTKCSFDAF